MATEILSGKVHVNTTINGESTDFLAEPRESLLETLRETLGLTGAKEGCNDGNCGACNVVMDGKKEKLKEENRNQI
jgi:carbon-monoxide dehydrogenase small subunit